MSALPGVSDTFDPELWDPVPGFDELTDITYHRAKAHGTVRIAFDRLAALTTPVRSRRVTASLHAAADEKPKMPATGFEGPHPSADVVVERNPLMTRH